MRGGTFCTTLDAYSLARFGCYCKLEEGCFCFTRTFAFLFWNSAGWKLGFWENVVFSDETRVRLNSDGVVRVFRKTGRRFCPKNIQGIRTDKRSMMFWGAIRSDGRKMLIKCPATLNSYGYLEILKQYDRHLNIPDLVFQQDNAPVHKSEVVRNFLAQEQWEVLDWPAYSPDLNPIENIWAIFKKSLRGQIVTWENLEEKVMEVWNNINPDVVRNLYSSYENRLVKVIKNHGSLTGYWFIICFNSCFKFYCSEFFLKKCWCT